MSKAIEKALSAPLVSHFTPSLMAHSTLETITVERAELADELVGEIVESATNPTKSQTLLVGPRGIGKTHLVTLVYHRLRAANPTNLCVAWLREEEYGVVSWLDLLLRIFRALEEDVPRSTPRAQLDLLYDLPTEVAEKQAQTLLLEYLAGRTLLLLAENLDAIFADIKEIGQRKWRAWMQEHPVVTTLATTPGLFGGISGRNAPFYGYFRIEPLHALGVDGAVLLLQKIARARGDEELAEFIETPVGHARVRAVHHLAGGNFRIYVVFSSFLNKSSLDDLVAPFLQLLDELTPYYQGHLATLSSQQRKIIEVLCDYGGAMPVKLLASRGFMTQQTASSQLVTLRERGYVVAHSRGRESFYELREPLLRLCLQVKKQRGEPVALLIDFLRIWYRHEELSHRLESCAPEASWEREYFSRALAEKEKETEDPVAAACERDFTIALEKEEWEKAVRICDELDAVRTEAIDKHNRGFCLWMLDREEEALIALEEATSLDPEIIHTYGFYGSILHDLERYKEALAAFDQVIVLALAQDDGDELAMGWQEKGFVLGNMGHNYQALLSFNKSLKIRPDFGKARIGKATAQRQLGHLNASLKTWRQLENDGYNPPQVRSGLADTLYIAGEKQQAFDYFQQLANEFPDDFAFQMGVVSCALDIFDFQTALCAATCALKIESESPCARFYLAQSLIGVESNEKSLGALDVAITYFESKPNHLLGHLHSLVETLYFTFEGSSSAVVWESIVRVFASNKTLSLLATALTKFASLLIRSIEREREIIGNIEAKEEVFVQARKALKWSRLWLELSAHSSQGDRATLHFAARLSAIALGVAASGDDRVLLDLPSEERAIVRELLARNFDEEATQIIEYE